MRRREFLTLLGGAAATWPLVARAQQSAMPVIGYLSVASAESAKSLVAYQLAAFRQGLSEVGYVEGRNVAIEYRWANDQYDRLPALAADLALRRVAVIVALGGPSAQTARAATTTIPVVFVVALDPVDVGLVASLNRPGGNVTGVTNLSFELGPKRLQLLHEMVPTATVMAVLVNPTNRNAESLAKEMHAAAQTLGLQLHILHASTERDIDTAFTNLGHLRAGGLVIGADPFFQYRNEQLAALALRHAMPTIFSREFAIAGGLMSYGGGITEMIRLAGTYTGRILKGEKPADLPVQQTTKVELIINMKTAKALGLTFPLTLLGRADAVIE